MKTTTFSRKSKQLPLLGHSIPRTELSDILDISIELLDRYPEILEIIEADLVKHGIEKKKKRLADRAWQIRHGELPGFETDGYTVPENLDLETGRPRDMTPIITYIFIVLRGHFSSLTATRAIDRIRDSKVVDVYIKTYGYGEMPGRSTAHENVNAVSLRTKDYIHQCQLEMVHAEGLDDFSELILDSTAVKADSCWPTDSGILCDIVHRAYRKSQRLNELFGIPNFMEGYMNTWLGKIKSYHFLISVTSGKGAKVKRRSVYRKLYREVEKAIRHIRKELKKHGSVMEAAHLPPSKRERLDKFWCSIENDMDDAELVMAYSRERIIDEKDADVEKIVSLSDGSAAFISKGGRETIVGYRPQVGRSGNGFVTVLHVPEGNASDAPQLEPLVRKVIENTGIAPRCVSTDDGYSSKKGRDAVLKIKGIEAVSISGSKGKDLISEEEWESELYKEARRNRSAVESLIFVLKYSFRFGRLRRRGIDAVREELLEKAIVHNFSRMALMRRRKNIPKAG